MNQTLEEIKALELKFDSIAINVKKFTGSVLPRLPIVLNNKSYVTLRYDL